MSYFEEGTERCLAWVRKAARCRQRPLYQRETSMHRVFNEIT
jgi:hypothetical protein